MPTTTTNYALYMYDASTDQAESFSDFRADIAGTSSSSNMQKLDVALDDHDTEIALLQARRGLIPVSAAFTSGTLYNATVSEITAYADNDVIDIVLDTDTNGTMTLQVNSLAVKSMMKINAAGTAINLDGKDLQAGRHYLFSFDLSADKWVWVAATGGDQINVEGTGGNLLQIASDNSIEDSTEHITDFTKNADTNVSGNSWVLDEDDMITDSNTKVPTQQSVKAYVDELEKCVGISVFQSDISVEVADGLVGIPISQLLGNYTAIKVVAMVHTLGVTGTTDIQIRRRRGGSDVDMLSTKAQISTTYWALGVFDPTYDDLNIGDLLYVDVDSIHSGTAPLGLSVIITMVVV